MERTAAAPICSVVLLLFATLTSPHFASAQTDEPRAQQLTSTAEEEDYPAVCRDGAGRIWLVYVAYRQAAPIDPAAIRRHEFDSLIARGNGDRLLLCWSEDGTRWSQPIEVIAGLRDLWRPAVVSFADGTVLVVWSEQVAGNWELFGRVFPRPAEDPHDRSPVFRITHNPGPDFHVVAVADGDQVWIGWQGWNGADFDIRAARLQLAPNRRTVRVQSVAVPGMTPANEWAPAIARDVSGGIWLAWDTYAAGNYDVIVARLNGPERHVLKAATSARFEARPSLAPDPKGGLWLAFEVGDEQWGKDFTIPESWGRNRGEVDPGRGLYEQRAIEIRRIVDGRVWTVRPQPYDALRNSFVPKPAGRWSLPRLAVDPSGAVWLAFRRHRDPHNIGGGEVWHSYVTRFLGDRWTEPVELPESAFILDSRPAVWSAATGHFAAVYAGDRRQRTQRRQNAELFAVTLRAEGRVRPATLEVPPKRQAERAPVHPHEQDDLRRFRAWNATVDGVTVRLFRGEFHRHTELTAHRDGDGLLEDMWRYALDAAQLDWMGNGDHDNGFGVEYHWWQVQKTSDLFHVPPRFTSVYSYERSNPWPNGHRNVILPERGIRPLPRGDLNGSPETGCPDTKMLYAYLKRFGGMCAAHTSATGMGTDWRDNDPVAEPVVEIFQGARQPFQNYEHLGAPRAAPRTDKPHRYRAGFVWEALAKGYRLGFQCSSDHYSTHIAYAVIIAPRCTRQSIIDAFQRRHCYGANDAIVLSVRCGDRIMGDEFTYRGKPKLEIEVDGTAPIRAVRVVRNNRYVYATSPNSRRCRVTFVDQEAEPGKLYYYYVRVEQENGAMAWSSPMWIHVR